MKDLFLIFNVYQRDTCLRTSDVVDATAKPLWVSRLAYYASSVYYV